MIWRTKVPAIQCKIEPSIGLTILTVRLSNLADKMGFISPFRPLRRVAPVNFLEAILIFCHEIFLAETLANELNVVLRRFHMQ